MPRLFVAVDAPDDIREQLMRLAVSEHGVKWVPREQLHLTLRFIGDFDDVERIRTALREVSISKITAQLTGVGQFPPRKRANVLWAGIQPVQEISQLAAAIERAVTSAGVEPDTRPFSPHLTVARLKDAAPSFAKNFLAEHAALASPPFELDHFVLYQSDISSKGAKHTALESYALRALR